MTSCIHPHHPRWPIARPLAPLLLLVCLPVAALGKSPVDQTLSVGGVKIHFGKLAVTEAEIKAIRVPVEIIIGDRDPMRRPWIAPLESVRRDWPVVEIPDAGHITCIMKPQFKAEIKKWLDAHAGC